MRDGVATSADVARAAGVSQATVSAVLRGRHGNIRVSEQTRQRVLAAAASLHYTPNTAAQALRRRRSGALAFISRTSWETPLNHPVPLLLSVQVMRAALRHGIRTIMHDATPDNPSTLLAFLRQQQVDGVLLHSPHHADEARTIAASGIPVVQLMRPQEIADTATVTCDFTGAIHEAVDYLAAAGHLRIGFIGVTSAHPFDRDREQHFRAALARQGIPLAERLLLRAANYSRTNGAILTGRLLDLPAPPTALFAASDTLAQGALRALYERAIRIPEQFSLVGFGAGAALPLIPPIPNITLPLDILAERAVARLVAQLDEQGVGEDQIVVPARFVTPDPSTVGHEGVE